MNVLLVYPKYPDTYWSYSHVLKFVSKKAAVPPLGLITMSAMLPENWNKKLVDMNLISLDPKDIQWADYVMISSMYIQKQSVDEVIKECKKQNAKIIAGGPLFTQEYNQYPEIDHFILNEAEITLKPFLKDLEDGIEPKRIYDTSEYADMSTTPVPDYHLLDNNKYVLMSIQVSRGCPFDCDFCEITSLLGHKVRKKNPDQIINELNVLYNIGWRGPVSIVDDNFIGSKKFVKTELLPLMTEWMRERNFPFTFNIQASIDLADEEELTKMLTDCGFDSAFIGIETPDEQSLNDCNKIQNKNRSLIDSVQKLQKSGIHVSGGFIVGFDSDNPSIFQNQIDFIQKSGIISAMVGLLNAPKNTKLYDRLEKENRITVDATGSNTDFSMNFVPKMDKDTLLNGYNSIIDNIYGAKPYYTRVRNYLLNYKKTHARSTHFSIRYIIAFMKSMWFIGLRNKGRGEYWKLFFWTMFNRPAYIVDAMTYAVYGYHYRKVYGLI